MKLLRALRKLMMLFLVAPAIFLSLSTRIIEVHAFISEQHTDVKVSEDGRAQREPSIAVNPANGNQIVVAAINEVDRMGYSRSIDGGATWSIWTDLTVSTYDVGEDPSTVFDRFGNSYILGLAKSSKSADNKHALFLAKSTDGGQSFTSTILQGLSYIDKPWMAVDTTKYPDKDRIIITWLQNTDTTCLLNCLNVKVGYVDGGQTLSLSGITTIWSSTDGRARWPMVATDNRDPTNPHVYVSWEVDGSNPQANGCNNSSASCKILIKRSNDHGFSWPLGPETATTAAVTGTQCVPFAALDQSKLAQTLAVDGSVSNVYVAWHDCRNNNLDIWLSYSTDLGVSWTLSPVKVNNEGITPAHQFWPAMTTFGGEVFVTFYDTRNDASHPDVYFAESDTHGSSFLPSLRVTDGSTASLAYDYMGVASAVDGVHPVWTDNRNSPTLDDIYTDKLTSCACGSVARGTLITMADGSRVPVQNLIAGDRVIMYDVYTGASLPATIVSIRETFVNNQLILYTQDGLPLRVDANPRLKFYTLTSDGLVLKPVTLFQAGDFIYNHDAGRWATLTQVNVIYGGSHEFYDLLTDPYLNTNGQYLNFIANGYADPCQIACKQGPTP